MNKPTDLLFFLLRSLINSNKDDQAVTISEEDCSFLYSLSVFHDLAPMIYCALKKYARIEKNKEMLLFEKQYYIALYRHINRTIAMEQIRHALKEEKIPFIFLKGSVIMDLYPEAWMRTSSDIDVLVQEKDLTRAVEAFEKNGMCRTSMSEHDVSFSTQEKYHIELHHSLLEDNRFPKACSILKRVWSQAIPIEENSFEFRMSEDLFFFFHIVHMVKHFENGGCGVRPFLDLWLLNNKTDHNDEYRLRLLNEGGLTTFYRKAKMLSEIWFASKAFEEDISELANYVIKGGVYGTENQLIAVRKTKSKSIFGYYINRLFPRFKTMRVLYPIIDKLPFLLPVFWICRWFKLLDPKVMKRTTNEITLEYSIDAETEKRTASLLRSLGLIQ